MVTTMITGFAIIIISIMSTPSKAAALRVVSYNVLSSHLASPSHFSQLNPEHLDSPRRLTKILTKLESEMAEDRVPIFCLQEVSYQWAGQLHSFFANKGYHVITGLYGRPFNGYMGVMTAWPTDVLDVVDVDISRLSDTVPPEAWPERKPEDGVLNQLYQSILGPPLKLLGLSKKEPENHWDSAKRRFNVLITASLREKASSQEFCIGNYHMPCAYYAPMVMTNHADMCIHHVQTLAKGKPYIVAGDFNIKPSEAVYRYLTTGKIDPADPSFPAPAWDHHEWKSSLLEPVRSAYAVANDGQEPEFTNFAQVGEQEPFVETLDYIFVGPTVKVVDVLPLPSSDNANGPFPNEVEPSDHILIAADIDIGSA